MVDKLKIPILLFALAAMVGAWPSSSKYGGSAPQFYWAAGGSDSNNCKSPVSACQTVAHFNSFSFPSAAIVNFNGGDTFSGGLVITTPGLTVTSYGTGQPIISSGNSSECVKAADQPGIKVNNLNCVAGGSNNTRGIYIYNDTVVQLAGATVTNNTVTNYGFDCIAVLGQNVTPSASTSSSLGFSNVTIAGNAGTGCTGNFHTNAWGPYIGSACIIAQIVNAPASNIGSFSDSQFSNVTVSNNLCANNNGDASASNGSGFGIVIGNTTTGTVANNLIHDNGSTQGASVGPAGILIHNDNGITVQANEVFNQSGAASHDGEGIDFDAGTRNSTMEYNYAHNNGQTTSGIVLAGDLDVGDFGQFNDNNTVRFNIAESQTFRGIAFGFFSDGSGTTNLKVYNNTLITRTTDATFGGCVRSTGGAAYTVNYSNNICYATSSNATVAFPSGFTTLTVTGNDYFSASAANAPNFTDDGGSTTETTLVAMQAKGYEKVSGSPVGTTSNPSFFGTPPGGNCSDLTTLCPAIYQLSSGTVAGAGKGQNLTTVYSINPGTQDYFGIAVTASTLPIGATSLVPTTAYSGPGDVVGSPWAFWGLRAFTANIALLHSKIVNFIRASDSHTCDVLAASAGGMGVTANCSSGLDNGQAASTWCNGTTCKATKIYDQTLGNNCNGSSCDAAQATSANQPTLAFSCVASLPCLQGTGTDVLQSATTIVPAVAQPFTITGEYDRTGSFTSQNQVGGDTFIFAAIIGWTTANQVLCYAGTVSPVTANDNAIHNVQCVMNGASGVAVVDGSATTINTGANTLGGGSGKAGVMGTAGLNNGLNGNWFEAGIWPSAFNATQYGNMSTNMAGYY